MLSDGFVASSSLSFWDQKSENINEERLHCSVERLNGVFISMSHYDAPYLTQSSPTPNANGMLQIDHDLCQRLSQIHARFERERFRKEVARAYLQKVEKLSYIKMNGRHHEYYLRRTDSCDVMVSNVLQIIDRENRET